MKKRIVIGVSGASGVIYAVRILQLLQAYSDIETHLVMSSAAEQNLVIETDYTADQVKALADKVYGEAQMDAALASGSFLTDGMIVVPCTIKTLSAIANSYTSNLLVRAADVMLKEKRKLVLVVRETPLHKGHLQLMTTAADLGAHIMPPIPAFYHQPQTIEDLIDHSVGKIFDYLAIEHKLFARWGEQDSLKG